MLKHISAYLLLMSCLFSWGQTENIWTKKASFAGLKREKAVAFSIGEYGYISCGVDTAENTHNDLWEYDPAADTWTQKASIPAAERKNAVAFVIQNKGYVGTGFDLDDALLGVKLNDFWEYNPLDNSWSAIANYPGGGNTGIYQATAFSVLNKGYVACGKIGSDDYIPEMWQYDPGTDTWTEKTPFPGGDRYQLISFVLENKAYIGLGTDHDVFRKDFYEYDPLTNTWEEKPDFPSTERAKASTFTIGTKGFILFGSDGGLKDELWEYSYYSGSWIMRAPFPGGNRNNAIAFTIGNKAYAGIGKGNSGKKQSFYEYAPVGPLSIYSTELDQIKVFPNPIQENSFVTLPNKINQGHYFIYNLNGTLIQREKFNASTFALSNNDIPHGLYLLIITDKLEQPMAVQKIIVL